MTSLRVSGFTWLTRQRDYCYQQDTIIAGRPDRLSDVFTGAFGCIVGPEAMDSCWFALSKVGKLVNFSVNLWILLLMSKTEFLAEEQLMIPSILRQSAICCFTRIFAAKAREYSALEILAAVVSSTNVPVSFDIFQTRRILFCVSLTLLQLPRSTTTRKMMIFLTTMMCTSMKRILTLEIGWRRIRHPSLT